MQIKKYIAGTLKEASQQMKKELGENAIVLSTRIVDDDPRFGGKRVFELTAGVEDNYDVRTAEQNKPKEVPRQKNFSDELKNLTEKVLTSPAAQKKAPRPVEQNLKLVPDAKLNYKKDFEHELREIADTLLQREVNKRIVDSIIIQLKKYSDFLQSSNIDNYVISTISSMIPTSNFEIQKRQKTKTIVMVGPTGVGKTTCIAKLAVISKILHNLNIGLISLDTYRLGAIDQLKIFSDISNIELRVAYDASEIPGYLNDYRKKDIVFIDTAGRSQNNKELLMDTKNFISTLKPDEVYLVLSTTSTTKNMLDVAEKFKILNYNGIVFTKLDEAVSFGNIINLTTQIGVPVKYLTNGQVIPDDIIAADPEFIANMIYTGKISK